VKILIKGGGIFRSSHLAFRGWGVKLKRSPRRGDLAAISTERPIRRGLKGVVAVVDRRQDGYLNGKTHQTGIERYSSVIASEFRHGMSVGYFPESLTETFLYEDSPSHLPWNALIRIPEAREQGLLGLEVSPKCSTYLLLASFPFR